MAGVVLLLLWLLLGNSVCLASGIVTFSVVEEARTLTVWRFGFREGDTSGVSVSAASGFSSVLERDFSILASEHIYS